MSLERQTPVADGKMLGSSRFELAPPRRFILPAILLLLSERPGYGYGLVPRLQECCLGRVDRPAVYRALAELEGDGLLESVSESPKAGQARRVYRVTSLGERVLRAWMGVIKEEHDALEKVLRRYQATGTADAVLAEVEGGWAAALGFGWSPVSSTSANLHRLLPGGADRTSRRRQADVPAIAAAGQAPTTPGRFTLIAERSAVLIEVRSTVGPLSFGAIGVTGWIEAAVTDGMLRTDLAPAACLEINVAALRSGNRVYDAELLRRVDARRFPLAVVELGGCEALLPGGLYRLNGDLTFHGVSRPAQGTVCVGVSDERRLIITGEHVFDIRDFAISSPTVLMLRIYPDVRVRLQAEAQLEEAL